MRPVDLEPSGQGLGRKGGEQPLDLRDGQRDYAGLGGRQAPSRPGC